MVTVNEAYQATCSMCALTAINTIGAGISGSELLNQSCFPTAEVLELDSDGQTSTRDMDSMHQTARGLCRKVGV